MQTLAPDSFCPLTNPQPYQRERAKPPSTLRIRLRIDRELTTKCWVCFIVWLGHGRCELECDSIANSISAAILRRPLEPPNEDTAVNFNDSAGSNVVWVRRDFDVFQPLSASMFQHQFQRQLGIAAAFLPWDNRIANVSEDMRGQL